MTNRDDVENFDGDEDDCDGDDYGEEENIQRFAKKFSVTLIAFVLFLGNSCSNDFYWTRVKSFATLFTNSLTD